MKRPVSSFRSFRPFSPFCPFRVSGCYLLELPFLAAGFLAAPVIELVVFAFLAARFFLFLTVGFMSPVVVVVAAAVFAAGFFAGAFLF